jgi:hypothetical protein
MSWSLVASPGDWPGRLNDSVTARKLGVLVRVHIALQPAAKHHVFCGLGVQLGLQGLWRHVGNVSQLRGHKAGGHAVKFGLRDGVGATVNLQNLAVFGFHIVDVLLAFGLSPES